MPFSPNDLLPLAWWSPRGAGVTLSSGRVSAQPDQSVSGHNLQQSAAGLRPVPNLSALNGAASVYYDAASRIMESADAPGVFKCLHDGTGGSVFLVFQTELASPGAQYGLIDNTTANSGINTGVSFAYLDVGGPTQAVTAYYPGGIGNNPTSGNGTAPAQTPMILEYGYKPGGALGDVYCHVSTPGSLDNVLWSQAAGGAPSAADPTGILTIGGFAALGALYSAQGYFGDIVVFNTVLSAPDRAALLGFLAGIFFGVPDLGASFDLAREGDRRVLSFGAGALFSLGPSYDLAREGDHRVLASGAGSVRSLGASFDLAREVDRRVLSSGRGAPVELFREAFDLAREGDRHILAFGSPPVHFVRLAFDLTKERDHGLLAFGAGLAPLVLFQRVPLVGGYTPSVTLPLLPTSPLGVDVTEGGSPLADLVICISYAGRKEYEVVWNGHAFAPLYSGSSVSTPVAGKKRFVLRRTGGWPASPAVEVHAVDTNGQEGSAVTRFATAVPPGPDHPVVSPFDPPGPLLPGSLTLVTFTVTDASSLLRDVLVLVRYAALPALYEVAWNGSTFTPAYRGSQIRVVAGGFRFYVYRAAGWPADPTLEVHAIDVTGNSL